MRSAAAGTECRAFSSSKRAAAPRVAAPARCCRQQQQQCRCGTPAATAPHVSPRRVAAAAVASQEAAAQQQAEANQEWVALVANAEFFCNDPQNEPMAEQLRERVRYFKEQNREIDFFLVPNPEWLDGKFAAQGKQVRRPCMALVSPDKTWITFMKLRLDRVLKVDLVGLSKEEALAAGEALPEFKRPEAWNAPYAMYSPGWWKVFYPPGAQ